MGELIPGIPQDVSKTSSPVFAGVSGSGSSSYFGSNYNFYRSVTTDAVTLCNYTKTSQASGGGSGSIPVGVMGTAEVTGGTFDHAVGTLGWIIPTTSYVAGTYIGTEGRLDVQRDGCVGYGINGLVKLDSANCNSQVYGLIGSAIPGPSYTGSSGIAVGVYGYARGCGANFNAIFGEGILAGDNANVAFRGYITDGAGTGTVYVGVNDENDALLWTVTDAKIDYFDVRLRDNAGVAMLRVLDSDGMPQFGVNTDGVIWVADGVTAPAASLTGMAGIYVDTSDGDLKIRFADGTVKTIVTDTP